MYQVTVLRFGKNIEVQEFKSLKGASAYAAAMRLMGYDIEMEEITTA